ncbi:MAG: penicillin-binding protein 1C [Legionella sp.]|nr:penicillin-binding protein 1C [Legionella sp.]
MKRKIPRIIIICVALFVSGYLLLFFLPPPKLLEQTSFSRAVFDEQGQLLRLTLSADEKFRLYTPFAMMPQELVEATLLQEDQYFFYHLGINPWATVKAIWQTYVLQSRRMGASTITMQVARLHYKLHTKSIKGKLQQLLRALQIEMHFSKKQILEAYLNLAPYGGNVEGVGAASLVYFGIPVQALTLPQSLTLSIIPQNPGKRLPERSDVQSIRNLLFQRWLVYHPQDKDQAGLFRLPLVMRKTTQLPYIAPHFVQTVLEHNVESNIIKTSLNARWQTLIERVTRLYLQRKQVYGVQNAAVLLVDTRDMQVKAMLGSADFFNTHISGQINGTEIRRSPGSTLKPFIYGLALDQGLIHPNTMLKDVPQSFNGYNPENFDYDFMGPIKAKDALALSRNIPAIYLANQLHHPSLYGLLEQAQVQGLRPESYYGLAISLGGTELTMHELVSLYALLVNKGIWQPLRILDENMPVREKRLLSPEASFLVLDMLRQTPTPNYVSKSVRALNIAWKTGTSSRYRDAWTVGVYGPYVLAVWAGNFDNSANPALIGKDIAAPLFFQLVEALRQVQPSIPAQSEFSSLNLKKIELCKASGMLPTPYCPEREWGWFIPGKSPIKTDTIYREVAINPQTGKRTCFIDSKTRFEVFEFWPSDLLAIFRRAGIARRTPPPFETGCMMASAQMISPQIISPQKGLTYAQALGGKPQIIPFTAVSDAGVQEVYWFVNDAFVAKIKAGTTFLWQAKPGQYTVRVVDDHGLSATQEIKVTLAG